MEMKDTASFGGDLEDFAVLRHHAIRALCGALMDRHTACKSPHPFCGRPGHHQSGDDYIELIAEVIPQGTMEKGIKPDLIGIYLCPASAASHMSTEEKWDTMEYIIRMVPTEPAPNRKLVVFPPQGGTYHAMYGPILNPVEGDYSTGSIDPDDARPINCNPEPRHCRWQYWESGLTKGDWLVPRFHCLQVFGEWWVVEVAGAHGMVQQVAALDFSDNPEHNFGIHDEKGPPTFINRMNPETEFSKVLRENVPISARSPLAGGLGELVHLPWRGPADF